MVDSEKGMMDGAERERSDRAPFVSAVRHQGEPNRSFRQSHDRSKSSVEGIADGDGEHHRIFAGNVLQLLDFCGTNSSGLCNVCNPVNCEGDIQRCFASKNLFFISLGLLIHSPTQVSSNDPIPPRVLIHLPPPLVSLSAHHRLYVL